MKIELAVRNQGHVPSFKNCKRTIKLNNGGTMPVTSRKVKAWMNRCIESFISQLFCVTQMDLHGTRMEMPPRSLIASYLPLDDSRQWVTELNIKAEEVAPGEEGATIIIEEAS